MTAIVDEPNCTGCEACVDSCPTGAISMANDKAKVNADDCTDCEACVDACPTGAISMA